MNYMQIKPVDIANGQGCRVSIWVSGCNRHCPGCFNPEAWSFDAGELFTADTLDEVLRMLEPDYIQGLTVLGGEPLAPENIEEMAEFLWIVGSTYPNKPIWVYTGYTWDELGEMHRADQLGYGHDLYTLLTNIDILVDGAFMQEQHDLKLQFRGSRNQRIIDVPKSLKKPYGECVLWGGDSYSHGEGLEPNDVRAYVRGATHE